MFEGLMQNDFPLTLHHPLHRLRTNYAERTVSTLSDDGTSVATFGEVGERIERLGRVLQRLGVGPGDRVGTFAWNSQRHFELYFAVPCSGAVLHTINVRLSAEQTTYIINHAADGVVFVDDTLVPLLEEITPQLGSVRHFVVMGAGSAGALPNALRYEELLEEAGPGPHDFPIVDERAAASLCYTSGTTGNPKGVLYSHRSIALHATGNCMVDSVGLSSADTLLSVVPMFHVNAWGAPYAAALTGASVVFPTRFLQPEPLARLISDEQCTMMNAVPTVFGDLLRHADEHHPDLRSLRRAICGGAPVPEALIRAWGDRHGVELVQAWGMTETSPICTVARPPAGAEGEQAWSYRAKQGRVVPWVELRIVGEDGPQPWDGQAVGEIEVRGPWIASRYYEDPSGDDNFDGPWLRTGDIGSVTPDGYVGITDRAKDLIKSGGEWISSVELENALMSHPDVLEAAVIAKPDERWTERPLACVVLREGASVSAAGLRDYLVPHVARYWLPDEIAFIPEVPKTSVGKFDKKVLRAQLRDGTLPGRSMVAAQPAGTS